MLGVVDDLLHLATPGPLVGDFISKPTYSLNRFLERCLIFTVGVRYTLGHLSRHVASSKDTVRTCYVHYKRSASFAIVRSTRYAYSSVW